MLRDKGLHCVVMFVSSHNQHPVQPAVKMSMTQTSGIPSLLLHRILGSLLARSFSNCGVKAVFNASEGWTERITSLQR